MSHFEEDTTTGLRLSVEGELLFFLKAETKKEALGALSESYQRRSEIAN